MAIGHNIRAIRLHGLMSQDDLAKQLGITQGAVSQWELGNKNPRAAMLPKIAKVLNCTVDELLTESA